MSDPDSTADSGESANSPRAGKPLSTTQDHSQRETPGDLKLASEEWIGGRLYRVWDDGGEPTARMWVSLRADTPGVLTRTEADALVALNRLDGRPWWRRWLRLKGWTH